MIDFIKMNISYILESDLLNNPLIDWKRKFNISTGELEYPITGKYYNMDIIINPKRKEMSGSLHKLTNEIKKGQNQNYDDFNFDDLKETINHIKDVFNFNLDKTIIENLECGLNINTHHKPETILYKNLIVWSDMEPSKNKTFDGKGKYIEFEKSQYSVKIYDKGKQSHRTEHILRFEYKSIKNEYIKKIGIRTFNDLLDKAKIQLVLNHLYESFDMSIIVDDLNPETIRNPRDRQIFVKGINPKSWSTFDNDSKGRKSKERFKKALNEILEKYNLNTIKKEIESELREKGEYLLKCHKMTDIQQTKDDLLECHTLTNISTMSVHCSDWSENTEMSQIDTYIYGQFVTSCKCIITGIDISHQTTNRKYLLESSIKEMRETSPETFMKLEREYRPQKKNIISYVDVCKEIAHRIRRKYQTLQVKEVVYMYSLFPLIGGNHQKNNQNDHDHRLKHSCTRAKLPS